MEAGGAGLSVCAVVDVSAECDVRTIVIPDLLSFMATGSFDGRVEGVKDINAAYQEKFGPGDYRPNLVITYWSFRAMIGFGAIASFGAVVAWWKTRKEWYNKDFDSVLKTKYRTIWYGCSIRRFHSQCSRQGEHQPRREPQVV
ncbi:MAG: cytochrome ubiquinol oxidase subunit I [Delftia acidovorans]|nr:cytochrome ubiquinol oxidase subunit I [Delftia acidovorans]